MNDAERERIDFLCGSKKVIIWEHKKQTWTHKNNSFMFKHLCFYPTFAPLTLDAINILLHTSFCLRKQYSPQLQRRCVVVARASLILWNEKVYGALEARTRNKEFCWAYEQCIRLFRRIARCELSISLLRTKNKLRTEQIAINFPSFVCRIIDFPRSRVHAV